MESSDTSIMIMYEDESVDVRYRNGMQLQLSPCGCEFMLLKAVDPHAHPLQPAERVRQRTRFAISTYKDLLVAALAFRNKYANRPYLPEELISAEHKKHFFTIESCVQWPEWTFCESEQGPGGEIIIRSEDGRAVLTLSPSGEEYSIDFTCSLSQPPKQHHCIQGLSKDPKGISSSYPQKSNLTNNDNPIEDVYQEREFRKKRPARSKSGSPGILSNFEHKPEQMYQSTTVTQHLSCCTVAPTWAYPLSLAQHHLVSHISINKEIVAEETRISNQEDKKLNISDRRSKLPQALPLTCPAPHRHRWNYKGPLPGDDESDLPRDLVKILWCQGVTYRILNEVVPVIEISPGDGSVIRSNGVLNSYFTHYKQPLQSEQAEELTYHLNSLPPDVLGQMYSVCSIVSRASRILSCYNQTKQLQMFPPGLTCLQEENQYSETVMFEPNTSSSMPVNNVNVTEIVENRFDLVATELNKIKRFNFMLENTHLLRGGGGHANQEKNSAEVINETVNEDYIAEALKKTSKTIQDIDALISESTLI